jgi:hypothetical protein
MISVEKLLYLRYRCFGETITVAAICIIMLTIKAGDGDCNS